MFDPSGVPGKDVVEKGTDAGGAIEIYHTLEDAEARCKYLSEFDDTLLYSGSYVLVGTMVIRTSYLLDTSGESKGSSGSTSENYDVLGREIMNEYEIRLLPNDDCILFVRGEEPLRDKKWHPWEHEEYNRARAYVKSIRANEEESLLSDDEMRLDETNDEEADFTFINEDSLKYMKKQANAGQNIRIEKIDAYDFMMLDLDRLNNSEDKDDEHESVEATIGRHQNPN